MLVPAPLYAAAAVDGARFCACCGFDQDCNMSSQTNPHSHLQPSMAITNKHFKGGTLLSDLSFSCYYHYTLPNQFFHLISVLFLIPSLSLLLCLLPLRLGVVSPLPLLVWFPLCWQFVNWD